MQTLNTIKLIAESIAMLLAPYAEVVIHDIPDDTIIAIYNNFSKRQSGDGSLLSAADLANDNECIIGPYNKTNWDGRLLKSISTMIYDQSHPRYLLCINIDLSQFERLQTSIMQFMYTASEQQPHEGLFKYDWREKINNYIQEYLQYHQLAAYRLTRQQKKALIRHLNEVGAFKGRHAASYIAHLLQISRATVYNYLK